MAIRSQASLNPTLTNFATGIAQDVMSDDAEFLAPTVDTGGAITGHYKIYNSKNAFQALDYGRALGGGFKRVDFAESDGNFNCLPVGLEIPIDDDEVGEGADRSRLDEAKIRTLIITAHLSRLNKVVTAVKAGLSASAGFGVWSNPDTDPINELDALAVAVATDLGLMPNRLALSVGSWQVLKNHPKVLARQPGSQNQGVTLAQLAGMLLNPRTDVRVIMLSKDTVKFGGTKTATNILGADVFSFFAEATPTQYDASFAKTFATRRGNVDRVETYREEGVTSDIHRVRWSEQIVVSSTASAKRITIS